MNILSLRQDFKGTIVDFFYQPTSKQGNLKKKVDVSSLVVIVPKKGEGKHAKCALFRLEGCFCNSLPR